MQLHRQRASWFFAHSLGSCVPARSRKTGPRVKPPVCCPSPPGTDSMTYAQIQIISLSGERIARFRADPTLTVQAIYRDLQRRLGLQIYRQALLYHNEVLDSGVYLSELGDGGEIELTLIVQNVSLVVTSSSDYTAKVWNWLNGECVQTLTGHVSDVHKVGFWVIVEHHCTFFEYSNPTRNNKRLIFNFAHPPLESVPLSYSLKPLDCTPPPPPTENGAGFSPDGTWVVTASFDSTARIWKLSSGDWALAWEPLNP